jgi:hypothetical protein
MQTHANGLDDEFAQMQTECKCVNQFVQKLTHTSKTPNYTLSHGGSSQGCEAFSLSAPCVAISAQFGCESSQAYKLSLHLACVPRHFDQVFLAHSHALPKLGDLVAELEDNEFAGVVMGGVLHPRPYQPARRFHQGRPFQAANSSRAAVASASACR